MAQDHLGDGTQCATTAAPFGANVPAIPFPITVGPPMTIAARLARAGGIISLEPVVQRDLCVLSELGGKAALAAQCP